MLKKRKKSLINSLNTKVATKQKPVLHSKSVDWSVCWMTGSWQLWRLMSCFFSPYCYKLMKPKENIFIFRVIISWLSCTPCHNITSASSLFRNYMFAMVYSIFVNLAAV